MTESQGSPMTPDDRCVCGHTRNHHNRFGRGRCLADGCDSLADGCDCERFTAPPLRGGEMTTRRITVTRAQHEAAKLLLECAHELGEPLDPAIQAIAHAMTGRTRDENQAWPFCCDDLRGATGTGTVTNGFRDGLHWGIPVGDATVLEIQHCPWCGHNLADLSPQAGVRKAPAYGPVIDRPWTYGKGEQWPS